MGNNRERGKRGEREARDVIRRCFGFPGCIRSAQVHGRYGADLDGTGRLHVEVKLRRSLAVMAFHRQAAGDAKAGKVPVVLMRQDKGPWMVMFEAELMQQVVDEINAARAAGKAGSDGQQ